jgi:regulator of sigma E protease
MLTVVSFAFVIGILVFVHELGHFLAAKRVGIRVLKFQLGFNPVVAKIHRGGTDYCLGAVPLGGFVKMAGEHDAAGDGTDTFASKTRWERLQVLAMGPVMNLGAALALTATVFMLGHHTPAYLKQPAAVGRVTSSTPAALADVHEGDIVIAVAGRHVTSWEDLERAVAMAPENRVLPLTVQRGGNDVTVSVISDDLKQGLLSAGDLGLEPVIRPQIVVVNSGEPGERGGLRVDDVVTVVNGKPVAAGDQLREAIAGSPGPLTLWVLRDGVEQNLSVRPANGRLGITFQNEVTSEQLSLPRAVVASVQQNIADAQLMLHTVWSIFMGSASPSELIGPIGMAQLSGQSARRGWLELVSLMSMLSLNLGLLNLLPIPVLDGGHILILAMERVMKRDFTRAAKRRFVTAGLAVLLMLMSTALYNDLARLWIGRTMP